MFAFSSFSLLTLLQVTGSAYVYTYLLVGELPAFLVGWGLCLEYSFSVAAVSRGLSGYFVLLLGTIGLELPSWLYNLPLGGTEESPKVVLDVVACLGSALITLYLTRGTKNSSRFNFIVTGLSLLVIFLVIIAGAFYVERSNWTPYAPYGVMGVFKGAAFVFFAYLGFDSIANLSEEVKNPERDLPIGIIGSLLICTSLYCGVCLVITGMVPYYDIDLDAPLAAAFTSKGASWAVILITIGAFAGLITTMLTCQMSAARLIFAMSRDGLIPAFLSRIDPKHHTPISANLVGGGVAALLAFVLDIEVLSGLVCAGTLIAFTMVCFAVLLLRLQESKASTITPQLRSEAIAIILVFGCGSGLLSAALALGIFWPSILLAVLFVFGPLLFVWIIFYRHVTSPEATSTNLAEVSPKRFYTPWVPFIPMLGIAVNVFMFVELSGQALFGAFFWFCLGGVIYFIYSMWNSKAPIPA